MQSNETMRRALSGKSPFFYRKKQEKKWVFPPNQQNVCIFFGFWWLMFADSSSPQRFLRERLRRKEKSKTVNCYFSVSLRCHPPFSFFLRLTSAHFKQTKFELNFPCCFYP
jgi:hypothetical protein